MGDTLVGKAVLQECAESDFFGYLYLIFQRADGSRFLDYVQVVSESVNWKHPETPVWKYRLYEDRLEGTPSINNPGMSFHNSFRWSVPFEKVRDMTPKEIRRRCIEINLAEFPELAAALPS